MNIYDLVPAIGILHPPLPMEFPTQEVSVFQVVIAKIQGEIRSCILVSSWRKVDRNFVAGWCACNGLYLLGSCVSFCCFCILWGFPACPCLVCQWINLCHLNESVKIAQRKQSLRKLHSIWLGIRRNYR